MSFFRPSWVKNAARVSRSRLSRLGSALLVSLVEPSWVLTAGLVPLGDAVWVLTAGLVRLGDAVWVAEKSSHRTTTSRCKYAGLRKARPSAALAVAVRQRDNGPCALALAGAPGPERWREGGKERWALERALRRQALGASRSALQAPQGPQSSDDLGAIHAARMRSTSDQGRDSTAERAAARFGLSAMGCEATRPRRTLRGYEASSSSAH